MKKPSIRKLYTLPIIGNLFHVFAIFVRLPKYFDKIDVSLDNLSTSIDRVRENNEKKIEDLITDNTQQLVYLNNRVNGLNSSLMTHPESTGKKKNDKRDDKYFANNHLMDDFYLEFENKFRGSEDMVKSRLEEYSKLFTEIKDKSLKKPVLDIGCGRGEFLSLLKEKGINAFGIDINEAMVKKSQEKGLDVKIGDAIKYLSDSKPKSYSAITGFHIIEHIEFADLLSLFTETYKSITDDGFVLFETPNPENVYVSSNTFYYDPSHLKPLPPQLIKYALETIGFRKVEIIYTHPEKEISDSNDANTEIRRRLFGPRDYAVIARK